MTNIESKHVTVNAEQSEVFTFIRDLNNLKELLPQDKISEWNSSEDECSFKVAGGYKIGMRFQGADQNDKITLVSTDVAPFPFTLNILLKNNGSETGAYQVCEANINPFLKMMVEKPLKNLFDYIADRLEKRFAS